MPCIIKRSDYELDGLKNTNLQKQLSSAVIMSNFTGNSSPWWNSNEHHNPQSVSKSLSLTMESPAQLNHGVKQFGIEVQDQDSSSTQSACLSHHELTATEGTNSQDQCISSGSGQYESYGKNIEGPVKPVMFLYPPDHVFHPSQIDFSQQMTHVPYPYAAHNFTGLITAYGPQPMIQPQMMGIASARVPLPLDLAEDGPIYVNAKQYNGILRRRQSRAKLEAQNKLVKSRKPYLHESRHIHALNRVRGSGGRFLSTKNFQQPEPTTAAGGSNRISNTMHFNQTEEDQSEYEGKGKKSVTSNGVIFRNPHSRLFSDIPSHYGGSTMQGSGMCSGNTQQRAPIVG